MDSILVLGSMGISNRDSKGRFYNQPVGGGGGSWRWPCWGLIYLGIVLNYVVLILGDEDEGSHHMQGHHTWCIYRDRSKEATLNRIFSV